jgi:hypothetical protein
MFLNLLYKNATRKPTIIPPNTLVDKEGIPTLVVKILSYFVESKVYHKKS